MNGTIHIGDCIEVMATLEENSVDAIVTDPPYGLEFMGKEWDRLGDVVEDPASVGGFQDGAGGNPYSRSRIRYGIGEQAQAWHHRWAEQAYRVLKPGGHIVSFGGTRTYHRMACAIEDAGFEIRDMLAWMYGSGFPKSLDVSKAIDKAAPREGMFSDFAAHYENQRRAKGFTHAAICEAGGFYDNHNHGGASVNWSAGHNVPTQDQWMVLQPLLELSLEWLPLIERIEAEREVVGKGTGCTRPGFAGDRFGDKATPCDVDVTIPPTDAAKEWNGWGTALKPAQEPIVLARKPLSEPTVATNVLKWGTGGINVDACRVAHNEECKMLPDQHGDDPGNFYAQGGRHGATLKLKPEGRWPANVVLDEDAGQLLDEQSGEAGAFAPVRGTEPTSDGMSGPVYGDEKGRIAHVHHADSGGASRFFYCAKASSGERNAWGLATNRHPTVKPVNLMRWLVRLITPPVGIVLDPFLGSGSTAIACEVEGVQWIGIEMDSEYAEIARQRVEAGWSEDGSHAKSLTPDQISFFDTIDQ